MSRYGRNVESRKKVLKMKQMTRIYALDQNYLRSDELKALIVDEPHAKFVLPDVALGCCRFHGHFVKV